MCGIVGLLSIESNWQVKSILYQSIIELLNRGYDSMGVSLIPSFENDGKQKHFLVKKALEKTEIFHYLRNENENIQNCMAHTRWATHGNVTVENAHPHVDTMINEMAIVHNGIIENDEYHRRELLKKGVTFRSQTDSEVIVNLIANAYCTVFSSIPCIRKRLENSILSVTPQLEGTYGIIIQHVKLPHVQYCARKGSPLLIGIQEDGSMGMIVSEKSAFLTNVSQYISLQDDSLYVVENKGHGIEYCSIGKVQVEERIYYHDIQEHDIHTCEGYSCFTEKEIWEQPSAITRCFNFGSRLHHGKVCLGGFTSVEHSLRECRNIYVFGCGTSYHTALIVCHFFREIHYFDIVMAIDASEFQWSELPQISTKSICVFITQSGETLDLYTVLQRIKNNDRFVTLGIVNVVDSLIARTVDAGVYMNCRREKGVASTKSFTSSVFIGWMMAKWFQNKACDEEATLALAFPSLMKSFLDSMVPTCVQLANKWKDYSSSMLVIGRGLDFFIAKEGSLKIKELTYVHAEAYSSSSLKHGPFALLHPDMIVFFIATDPIWYHKSANSFYEVYARKPQMVLICTPTFRESLKKNVNVVTLLVPESPWSFLLANVIFQCFALHLAQEKGYTPDFPRNLAKVVTVE